MNNTKEIASSRLQMDVANVLWDMLEKEIISQGHVATKKMLNDLEVSVHETVGGWEIIGSTVYYGKFVDTGRKSNIKGVPIDALIEWIRVKKIDLRGNSEKQVAFAIQTAIKRKGIPTDGNNNKKYFVERVLQAQQSNITTKINDIIGYWIDAEITSILKSIEV